MRFRFTRPRASHDTSSPPPLNDPQQQHTGSPRDEHLLASSSSLINITLPKRRPSSLASFATTTRSRSKKLVHEHLPPLKSTTRPGIRPTNNTRHSASSSIASTAESTRIASPPLPRLPSLVFERLTWTKDSTDEGDDEETLSQCLSPASTMVASPPMSSADHGFNKSEHEYYPAATPPAPAPCTTAPAPPPAPPIVFDALNVPHVVDAIFDPLEYTDLTALRQTCTRSTAWINSYLSYHAEWTLATETSLPEVSLWHGSRASRTCLGHQRVAEWATFNFLSQQPEQPTRRIGVITISGHYFPIHAFPLRCLHNARVVRLKTAALPASDTGYLDALRPGTALVAFRRLPNSWPIDPPSAADFLDAEGCVRETPTLPQAVHRLVVNMQYDDKYAGGRFRWFATSQVPQLKDVTVVFAGPRMDRAKKATSSGAAACARGLALAPILHEIVASAPGVVYSFVGLDEFNPAWVGKTWSEAAKEEAKGEAKGEGETGTAGVGRPEQHTARGSTATAQALVSVLGELMAARSNGGRSKGWSTTEGVRRVVAERVRYYTHDEYRRAVGEEQYEIDCC